MKNEIIIRNAQREDVRQIAEILVEDWKKAYRGIIDDDFLDAMDADQRYEIEVKRYQKYVVATEGSAVLGYAWLEMTGDGAADCEVVALYVRYSRRNGGIGKRLLQDAMRRFREAGKKRMILWCLKENDEARRFYERAGGQAFGTGSHNWGGREYDMTAYLYDLEEAPTYEDAAAAIPPGRYRHFKGRDYEVIAVARHSETEEPMVVYRALYGEGGVWVRPASMWNETVERGGRKYRRFYRLDRIERVEQYERLFDEATARPDVEKLRLLDAYYTSGEWREDYEADERGEFPPDMKRGVLSQDALYDLLERGTKT